MKKIISLFLAAALLIAFAVPAFAQETAKFTVVDFAPDGNLDSDFVAVTAATGTMGLSSVFVLENGSPVTVTAKNGATVQEIYLTGYVYGQSSQSTGRQPTKTMISGAVGAIRLRDSGADSGYATEPAQYLHVSATAGSVARYGDDYYISGINAETVTVSSTATQKLTLITVVYSLPLTKQEIIDTANEKGAAFTAEKANYKTAIDTYNAAKNTFAPHKSNYDAFEKAKAAWETADNNYKALENNNTAAKTELEKAKSNYTEIRNTYLALRERAKALNLTEADGLPAEIAEDSAISAFMPAPDINTLPVPGSDAEINLTAAASAGEIILSRTSLSTIYKSLTITNTTGGNIKDVYLTLKSTTGIVVGSTNLNTDHGYFKNKSIGKSGVHFAVTGVNYPSVTISLPQSVGRVITLDFSKITVTYTRAYNKEETIAALKENGTAYINAQTTLINAKNKADAAQSALANAAAAHSSALTDWNAAQNKWNGEKSAYETAANTFAEAESAFKTAQDKYIEIRDDYKAFYAAGKADLAEMNAALGLDAADGLPAEIVDDVTTGQAANTGSTLSAGNIWIIVAIAVAALGAAAAVIIIKKKKQPAQE